MQDQIEATTTRKCHGQAEEFVALTIFAGAGLEESLRALGFFRGDLKAEGCAECFEIHRKQEPAPGNGCGLKARAPFGQSYPAEQIRQQILDGDALLLL